MPFIFITVPGILMLILLALLFPRLVRAFVILCFVGVAGVIGLAVLGSMP